ncbi:acetyl-CoA acetyltransferase [Corynebacterium humireducens NBRC 106098 = DSM 45392]|uniref:Probable acetyl-CoA acetyltransferase n=1 Tax=Corynebacterium humireducens NBRC 106098 = DSM 45392 TaxID=1223515 RepID=A0A0B5D187_9CORY|nr:acetyl-CoA C-acetyltransferase [Corynebacterium humireducens]AJE32605.1 acetyl-CoA acetyltransferase [Corynebacterium humireducens NBRC 106098 = DSM 45392]
MSNLTPHADDVVILAGARTPQGKLLGSLASLSAVDLGAHAVRHAVERAGIQPSDVDHVILGQVLQAGAGQNPARQTALKAGLDPRVVAETVNKVCLSGLDAVIHAARLIRLGDADVVVAGGQESMTNAAHVVRGARQGKGYGAMELADTAEVDGLTDAAEGISMGVLTEGPLSSLNISREEQDEIAAASHQRAAAAQSAGVFDSEIAPISIPQRKGDPVVVSADEGIRANTTTESLSGLRPAFTRDGSITAGNASPISDGAAAVVLTRRSWAEERGLDYLAVVGVAGQTGGPDNSLHSQPSDSLKAALDRAGWEAGDLDFVEINEAFGAVAVQSLRDLDYPAEQCNIYGGAIALGHPIGASGARLVLTAARELDRRGAGKAGVSLCGGGGQGDALLLYRN